MSIHHSFSIEYATKYGIEEAILIQHIQFWIFQNERLKRNFHEGKTWMYQTQEELAAIYPYWNRDKVQKLLKKLVDKDVLIKGNFNKNIFDRTCWYTFKNKEMFTIVLNNTMDCSEQHDPECGTAQSIIGTDTNTDTKPNTYAPPKGDAKKSNLFKKIERKQRKSNVETSDEEHSKLLAKYGEDVTEKCYEHLSFWKSSKSESDPKSVAKHTDYYRIAKWVAKEVLEQSQQQKSQPSSICQEELAEKHRIHTQSFIKKYFNSFKSKDLYIVDKIDRVEIQDAKIYYNDKNFIEKASKEFKKYGYS